MRSVSACGFCGRAESVGVGRGSLFMARPHSFAVRAQSPSRTSRYQLSRRSFLTNFGGGTAAIAIFGLAGCTSSGSDGAASDEASSNTNPSNGSASNTSEGAASDSETTSPSTPQPGTLAWERVNLGFVSAYVLARGNEIAVVDTGSSGSEGEILNAISVLGGGWSDLKHLVLTHAHGDHVGSVAAVLENATDAQAHIGEADLGNVDAGNGRELNALVDGDEVFGLQIIGTPGHTPGHISVYDEMSGLLLAGDAMNGENGGIAGANPQFTSDMDLASQSIKRLSSRTIDTVLFGHGEPVIEDAQRQLEELAESL